jgi:hypothetical protein
MKCPGDVLVMWRSLAVRWFAAAQEWNARVATSVPLAALRVRTQYQQRKVEGGGKWMCVIIVEQPQQNFRQFSGTASNKTSIFFPEPTLISPAPLSSPPCLFLAFH